MKSKRKNILEQAINNAGLNADETSKMQKQLDANPNVQLMRKMVSKQPLVPPSQMPYFLRGLAIVNNPKAYKSLVKKSGLGKLFKTSGVNTDDIVKATTVAMSGFTKSLADASAAFTIKGGDVLSKKIANRKQGRVNEQMAPGPEDEMLAAIDAARNNAGAWLKDSLANKVEDLYSGSPQETMSEPEDLEENRLREAVRERIKKIMRKG